MLFLVGCTTTNTFVQDTTQQDATQTSNSDDEKTVKVDVFDWKNALLKDVNTGEEFRINDFKGKLILLESFAVWCPTCTRQQKEIKEFHESVGDDIISISLDTDPNEDEERVLQHATSNGFGWYYAISPREVTQSLVDEFGVSFVNAPLAPVLLICEDQSARLLRSGVKNADALKEEVEKGC
ncbi:redoxin family protein [Candidatus Woesearchaeota archaeon]|nr:redoxin family protein [Candidatus Woesearchaeota archaeon]